MADGAYGIEADMPPIEPDLAPSKPVDTVADEQSTEEEAQHVAKLIRTIKADKQYHAKAFKTMKRDMRLAMHGYDNVSGWHDGLYTANISGRHVKQKTAQLYAKNPKVVAKRRDTLDFTVWDETPDSLKAAFTAVQMGTQMMTMAMQQQQAAPPIVDELGQVSRPSLPTPDPKLMEAFQQAQSVIQDYTDGMTRRAEIKKLGRTLEILFNYFLREQAPYEFKKGAKTLVRRALTTGVGYLELNFQRETGPSPLVEANMRDCRTRLDHLERLMKEEADGELDCESEINELNESLNALQQEPEIVLTEGLIIDYPSSTRVIPDRLCTALDGFIGARHIAIEYLYTCDEVEELFKVDLKNGYKGYSHLNNFDSAGSDGDSVTVEDDNPQGDLFGRPKKQADMVCVWKYYDKPSGLVYYVADGYNKFLRPPAQPDVFVSTFWPLYTLTFNQSESEDELFPPSDVALIKSMQDDHNRSRQGKREHRKAARPRWVTAKGALDLEAIETFKKLEPFGVAVINKDPGVKVEDLFQVMKTPGVDPNLYDTGEGFSDIQLVVGSQQASMGASTADVTATQSSIAAGAANTTDSSSVDELDAFLSLVARGAGEILLKEMSPEKVLEIAGPGAVWPDMTLSDIANEIYLEVQAGSTGKPNQAVELANWQKILPFLLQMSGISPTWMARETVRRLDDNVDLTEALASGIPSTVAQNALASAGAAMGVGGPPPGGAAPPGAPPGGSPPMPEAQGPQGAGQGPAGAQNGPAGPALAQAGSTAPMGSNHGGPLG